MDLIVVNEEDCQAVQLTSNLMKLSVNLYEVNSIDS